MNEDIRQKISQTMKGKMPANIEMLKKSNKGKKLSYEHKIKLSKSHLKNPTRYWFGKNKIIRYV